MGNRMNPSIAKTHRKKNTPFTRMARPIDKQIVLPFPKTYLRHPLLTTMTLPYAPLTPPLTEPCLAPRHNSVPEHSYPAHERGTPRKLER